MVVTTVSEFYLVPALCCYWPFWQCSDLHVGANTQQYFNLSLRIKWLLLPFLGNTYLRAVFLLCKS